MLIDSIVTQTLKQASAWLFVRVVWAKQEKTSGGSLLLWVQADISFPNSKLKRLRQRINWKFASSCSLLVLIKPCEFDRLLGFVSVSS
jgi:hypothetical protein